MVDRHHNCSNVTEIDGIVITKLDGTAKGGIAIAIQAELNVPVKFIGIGEKIDDLQRFDPSIRMSSSLRSSSKTENSASKIGRAHV